jgi:hypothetical protein
MGYRAFGPVPVFDEENDYVPGAAKHVAMICQNFASGRL